MQNNDLLAVNPSETPNAQRPTKRVLADPKPLQQLQYGETPLWQQKMTEQQRFNIKFTDEGKDVCINFSEIETEHYYPKAVEFLKSSSDTTYVHQSPKGETIIEKTFENDKT